MERNNWTDKEYKIEQLMIFPNPANDRLVLELVKSLGVKENMIGSLIGVLLSIRNETIENEYVEYLKDYLPNGEKINTFFLEKDMFFDLGSSTDILPKEYQAETNYIYFKRTGASFKNFLKVDDFQHPCRREVFEAFLLDAKSRTDSVTIPKLSEEEISEYFSIVKFRQKNLHGFLYGIDSDSFAKFKFDFESIRLENCISTEFPVQILDYKNLYSLSISRTPLKSIPDNWNNLARFGELRFDQNDLIFDNFDFVQTLPNLTDLSLGSNKIVHPYSLINKKRLPLKGDLNFENIFPFKIMDNQSPFIYRNELVLKIASVLGSLDISKEQKEFLFYELAHKDIHQKPFNYLFEGIDEATIKILTEEKLKDLFLDLPY